jgi:hypothetical protein
MALTMTRASEKEMGFLPSYGTARILIHSYPHY